MDLSTGIFWLGALALLGFAYWKAPEVAAEGLRSGADLLWSVLPRLLAAFAIAGLLQVLIPQEIILRWIGPESGWRGIVVASVAGPLTPGGPMLSFPILAGLHQAGAGLGPLVAYLTGWSLLGLHRILAWELPLLGPHFVGVRLAVSLLLPPIAGYLAGVLARQ
jgi:uncharacterized membrane protein YraQ (UPF0718 family)